MTRKFKTGDQVTVRGVPGQASSWLFDGTQGAIHAIHECRLYPNEVKFQHGGTLCFDDNELTHTAEENPGRRLLDETSGFPHGIDSEAAQKTMRAAVTSQDPGEHIDIATVIKHLENAKQYLETEIQRLKEVL